MKTVFEYKRGYRKGYKIKKSKIGQFYIYKMNKKQLKQGFETLHNAKKWMVSGFINS